MAITDVAQLKKFVETKIGDLTSADFITVDVEKAALIGDEWFVRVRAYSTSEGTKEFELTINAENERVVSFSKIK